MSLNSNTPDLLPKEVLNKTLPGMPGLQSSPVVPNERVLLLILAAVQFVHVIDFMIIMPLGPQLQNTLRIAPSDFGKVVSAYALSAGVFGFLGSFYIDRFDRKLALMVLFAGFAIGTVSCGLVQSYEPLILARILTGAFGGILSGLTLAIVGDAVPLERRSQGMATVMASFSFATALGVPMGFYIANHYNWHMPFLVLGVMAVLVMIPMALYMPPMKMHMTRGPRSPLTIIKSVSSDPNQLRALLFMAVMMTGVFTVVPLISTYMVFNVGVAQKDLTYIYLIGGVATIFTSRIVGKLSDRLGRLKVFTVAIILSIIPILVTTHMPVWPLWAALTTTTIFFILSNARIIPSSAMVSAVVTPQARGGFMSLSSAVQNVSAGIASGLAGYIVSTNSEGRLVHYNIVGYIAVASVIIALLLARKLKAVS